MDVQQHHRSTSSLAQPVKAYNRDRPFSASSTASPRKGLQQRQAFFRQFNCLNQKRPRKYTGLLSATSIRFLVQSYSRPTKSIGCCFCCCFRCCSCCCLLVTIASIYNYTATKESTYQCTTATTHATDDQSCAGIVTLVEMDWQAVRILRGSLNLEKTTRYPKAVSYLLVTLMFCLLDFCLSLQQAGMHDNNNVHLLI